MDIEGAFEAAEKIEDSLRKASTLRFIAQAQAKALDIDGARVTLQMALEVAEEIEIFL